MSGIIMNHFGKLGVKFRNVEIHLLYKGCSNMCLNKLLLFYILCILVYQLDLDVI